MPCSCSPSSRPCSRFGSARACSSSARRGACSPSGWLESGRPAPSRGEAMATRYDFALPTDLTGWTTFGQTATHFTWDYDGESADLLALYAKSKRDQWDARLRVDWSLDYDPEDPMKLDERLIPLYGTEIWDRLSP